MIDNQQESTPHGLNAGIKASSGEYVMIPGAHSGYRKIHFNYIYKKITSVRQVFPMLYLLTLFLAAISWLFFMPLFYLTLGLTILHSLLALYFASVKSKNLKKFLLILKSFYILHISYGLGYLIGIVRVPFKKLS